MPRYLHTLIDDLPKSDWRSKLTSFFKRFHANLSYHQDTTKLLDKCIWMSTADGSPCKFSHTQSIAHNLDIVQQELLKAKYRNLVFRAINVAAGGHFEAYLPLTLVSRRWRARYYSDLLTLILRDRWPGSADKIDQCMIEMKERLPPQLTWQPKLPSEDTFETKIPRREPTLQGLDLVLEWSYEVPTIQLFFGSLDLGIYIAQPYTERPRLNTLRMVDVTAQGSPHCRVALMVNSDCVLGHLKQFFEDSFATGFKSVSEDVENRLFDALVLCLHAAVWGTTEYLAASIKLIQNIVSTSKRLTRMLIR
jgi:hypothetical protein